MFCSLPHCLIVDLLLRGTRCKLVGTCSSRESGQAFAVLLPVRTVGVMGDGRTYDHVCALRAVTSTDGMTADSYPFDHAFLAETATRIVNEVRGSTG